MKYLGQERPYISVAKLRELLIELDGSNFIRVGGITELVVVNDTRQKKVAFIDLLKDEIREVETTS